MRIATGTYSDQCIIWDVNGGDHKVVHIGREKPSSSVIPVLQNNDYNVHPKRRKFTDDMEMCNDTTQEFGGGDIGTNSTGQNMVVQALGNTWTKSFSGEMKSEYMVTLDYHQEQRGNKHNGQPQISFARKTSVLAASHDVFALAASGQLHVYDIKR